MLYDGFRLLGLFARQWGLRYKGLTTQESSFVRPRGLRIVLIAVVAHHELQLALISSEYQLFGLLGRHLKRHGLHFRWLALVFGRINFRPAREHLDVLQYDLGNWTVRCARLREGDNDGHYVHE